MLAGSPVAMCNVEVGIGSWFARRERVPRNRLLVWCLIGLAMSGSTGCAPTSARTAGIDRPPRSTEQRIGPRFAPRGGQPRRQRGAASVPLPNPADDDARPTGTSYSPSLEVRVPESSNSGTTSALTYERARDLDLAVVTSNATWQPAGTTVANTALVVAIAAAIASLVGWLALGRRRRT